MNPRRRRHNKRARVMARRVEVARIYRKHWREAHRAIVAERIAKFEAREGMPP